MGNARNIFVPVAEYRAQDSAYMADLWCCCSVKVFFFIDNADRRQNLLGRVNTWAAALRPRLRILLVEPSNAGELLEDCGLTLADMPTWAAQDTQGSLGLALLRA